MDRQLLRPRARGPAAPARGGRRPSRAQGHAHDRAGDLRRGVGRGRVRDDRGVAGRSRAASWASAARARCRRRCRCSATSSRRRSAARRSRSGRAWAGTFTAVGPLVGGLLLAHFWWGSVFLVNVPVVIVALVLVARWVPRSHDPATPPIDRWSALLWWGSLTALIVAIIEGPAARLGRRRWSCCSGVGGGGPVRRVRAPGGRTRSAPLIEDETRRDPRLLWGAAVITALFFGVIGMQFVLTQWIQGPRGLRARSRPVSTSCRPR